MIETIKIIIDEKPYLFDVKNRHILRLSDINKLIKMNPNNYFLTVSYKGEKILTDEILESIFDTENDMIELQIKLNIVMGILLKSRELQIVWLEL